MFKFMMKLISPLITGLIFISGAASAQIKDLKSKDFQSKIEATPHAVILDLRTDDELKEGIIPGAKQIDYFRKDFENAIKSLDKNKPYFIYCASGVRSGETLALMKSNGFSQVYNLEGGFRRWKKDDMPIVPNQ
jgi:rhodanese-related sulfurtransferase